MQWDITYGVNFLEPLSIISVILQLASAAPEFESRFAQFEKDVVALQRSIQQQQNRFDRSMQQVNTRLEQELVKIVEEIAQDRQLTMVIQRKNVVIYDSTTDVTDEALRRLNERTKNLTVTFQRDDN